MKVEHVSKNVYRVRRTLNKKKYELYFDHKPTERELAIAWAEALEDESHGQSGTFLSLANEYIDNRSSVLSPSTIHTYYKNLRQISGDFKQLNLYEIRSKDIQKEINDFAATHAPKTVKTLYGFISSVITSYRPQAAYKVSLPQRIEKDAYKPTEKDIERILDEVKGTNYSVPFQLGVSGLRRGEICALTMDDLIGNKLYIRKTMVYNSNNNWIVKENPKTDASNRVIIIPDSLVKEIEDQGFIYNNHPNALNKAIHRVQKRLGIPAFKFHALRSFFASYAHAKGIPDLYIMQMGGWATDSVMKSFYRKSIEEEGQKYMKDFLSTIPGMEVK